MKRTFWKKALTFALSAALAVSASAVAFADETTPENTNEIIATSEPGEAPVALQGNATDPVAKIGGNGYASLKEAVSQVNDGETIVLQKNVDDGEGIGVFEKENFAKNFTIDFNNHSYTVTSNFVGSPSYETQAFHLEKDYTITLKNGTIGADENQVNAKMLIQNYSNLTLDNMVLNFGKDGQYTFSNNNGTIVIKNSTVNATGTNAVALDVYSSSKNYTGANITIENSTINGNIEVGYSSGADTSKLGLTIESGTINGNILGSGEAKNNTAFLKDRVKIQGGTFSDPSALAYAANADNVNVTLSADYTGNVVVPAGVTATIDLNGHVITNKGDNHTIENHGTLTVVGNAGGVRSQDASKGAVYNAPGATATLDGGMYSGNKWYVIKNLGNMTIDNIGLNQEDAGSSGIANGYYGDVSTDCGNAEPATEEEANVHLTIQKGDFSGGMNVIKNDDFGVLEINGGSFTNTFGPSVLNWHKATINNGSFTVPNGSWGVVANGYCSAIADVGDLTINGGEFYASVDGALFSWGEGAANGKGTITITNGAFISGGRLFIDSDVPYAFDITGGTFDMNMKDYCAEGYVGDIKVGNFYLVHKHNTEIVDHPAMEPTCTVNGVTEQRRCSVCNRVSKPFQVIPALGHDLKLVAEVKATTEKEGNLAYYVCQNDNNEWFWDADGKNLIENHDDVKISKLPEPVVEPGETKVDVGSEVTNKEVSQAAAESLKVTDTDALAGNVAKEVEKVNQDETLKNEAKEQFAALGIDVPTESITMIVKPFPQVTVTGDKDGILSMEINLAYTVDAVAGGKRVTVQSEPKVIDNKDIEHPTTISIKLPEGYRDVQLVRHELSGNRGVKYYPVEIDENGVATFVVPAEDGFSPFTMARNQTVTVKLDGVQYTYSTMDTLDGGKVLPTLSKNNYLFKGWKFDGIANQHFNMTAELFEALLDKNAVVVGSSVFEGPLSEHPEIEEAKKNGTWGVDENKPAPTAKPAAAAAVTPVRSSIPKTSDDSNLMLWVCLMGIAALGLGGAVYMKKRNHQ